MPKLMTCGMIKFRVRMTRIVTKDVEVTATDMYQAHDGGEARLARLR